MPDLVRVTSFPVIVTAPPFPGAEAVALINESVKDIGPFNELSVTDNGAPLLELFRRLCGGEPYPIRLYRLVSDDGAAPEVRCAGIARMLEEGRGLGQG